MPNQNQQEDQYSRIYRYIKPGNTDPGTWRLAYPSQNFSGGGSGGGGSPIDVDGIPPVEVDTTVGAITVHTVSLNFQKLKPRR